MSRTRFAFAALVAAVVPLSADAATVINFPNFADCSTLQVNGNAACTSNVLRVTPATFGQSGSAFSKTLIPLGAGSTFSTVFSFQITGSGGAADGDGLGADGLTFTVQPNASTAGGGGGGIGYQGILNSVAVEFDTWNNGAGAGDPDGNHVGVDLNGSVFSVVTASVATRMNNGAVWWAWIDYNGTVLELRLSPTSTRPSSPTLSYAVSLATVLGGTSAYVGFTSGTGAAFGNHDVLTWQFDNSFSPFGAAPNPVPTLSPAWLAAILLAVAGVGAAALRSQRHG
ncbi:MAG TPA: PEP-CTERM sorting domain-containing protein [Casimicrobiaceae bacterium]|nr:PEP-CTERM sorting domain-containing protein [Casimicrobiaceae bacterium]